MPLCPIKAKARRQKYYERDREKILARNRAFKAANPEYAKQWYQDNKEKRLKQIRIQRDKIQNYVRTEKVKRGCSQCGFNAHHAALHWHHPNDDKETALATCYSMKKAIAEIAKCIVLCANCHSIHHWEAKPPTILEQELTDDEKQLLEYERRGISIL